MEVERRADRDHRMSVAKVLESLSWQSGAWVSELYSTVLSSLVLHWLAKKAIFGGLKTHFRSIMVVHTSIGM